MNLNQLLLIILFILVSGCDNKDKSTSIENPNSLSEKKNEKMFVYLILDNSGSTVSDNLEKIDSTFIRKMIEEIGKQGGGKIWMNYVDESSNNNPGLYTQVKNTSLGYLAPEKPNEQSFSSKMKYSKAFKEYKKNLTLYETKIENRKKELLSMKDNIDEQMKEILIFLDEIYNNKPKYSDCFGVLNLAIKAISREEIESKKHIIAFSDLKHDANKIKIEKIPQSISVTRVHHSTQIPKYDWLIPSNDLTNQNQLLNKLFHQK